MQAHSTPVPADLAGRRRSLLALEPGLRARDLAARLDVSEAELVAAGDSVRLRDDWPAVIGHVPALGPVMALTRNESCVHEKTGTYGLLEVNGPDGLIPGEAIDLRLFFRHWSSGFAATEDGPRGTRNSLQFFGADGTAVHKIYAVDATDAAAWSGLVGRFATLHAPLPIVPPPPVPPRRPDAEVDVAGLHADWDGLLDTHAFFPMLRRHGLQRTQALRLAGPGRARPVTPGALRQALAAASLDRTGIMVFVGNPGVIQIHAGPVHRLRATGPWFNVLDAGFNLHLREDHIEAAWVVRKPTSDGDVTSLELFDAGGGQIASLFGCRKPGRPEDPSWRRIAASLR